MRRHLGILDHLLGGLSLGQYGFDLELVELLVLQHNSVDVDSVVVAPNDQELVT